MEEEEERASQRGKKGGEFAKLSKSLSEEQLKAELSMEDAAAVEVVQVRAQFWRNSGAILAQILAQLF